MLRCRTRLLPSGSRERFWFAQQFRFISVIRGVQFFAPYQRLGGWTARSPSPGEPHRPLLRGDPDDIWQVAAAFATAFLDRYKPKPRCFPNGILNHSATHPSPGRNL